MLCHQGEKIHGLVLEYHKKGKKKGIEEMLHEGRRLKPDGMSKEDRCKDMQPICISLGQAEVLENDWLRRQ